VGWSDAVEEMRREGKGREENLRRLEAEREDLAAERDVLRKELVDSREREDALKAEAILRVTKAEEKARQESGDRITALAQALEEAKLEALRWSDDAARVRRQMKDLREAELRAEDDTAFHETGRRKLEGALKLLVRAAVPMMNRLAEIRAEKTILWGLVKQGWEWEAQLKELARAASASGSPQGVKAKVGLRTVSIAVIAINRMKRMAEDAAEERDRAGGEEFYTPNGKGSRGRNKRRRAGSAFEGLLSEDEVKRESIGDRLPNIEGQVTEADVEAVISAVTVGPKEWARGGLVRDLGRGLFDFLARGGTVGGVRGGDAVRNVRRGMGVMARRVNELEEERVKMRVIASQKAEEHKRLKEHSQKIVSLFDLEKRKNRELDERQAALAKECLESVPSSKVQALSEELAQSKKAHANIEAEFSRLRQIYSEAQGAMQTQEELVEAVKKELARTHKQLEVSQETVVRLRSESEASASSSERKSKPSRKKK